MRVVHPFPARITLLGIVPEWPREQPLILPLPFLCWRVLEKVFPIRISRMYHLRLFPNELIIVCSVILQESIVWKQE